MVTFVVEGVVAGARGQVRARIPPRVQYPLQGPGALPAKRKSRE
jgi:hypothetical protein